MKPLIGVLGNIKKSKSHTMTEIVHLDSLYIDAIEKCSGIAMVIPATINEENLREQIKIMDGIILTGGVDINPILYNEEPRENLGEVNEKLDKFNLLATKIAIELNKPILGVCRGIQVLNVSLGGTLYQDMSYIEGCFIKHSQLSNPHTKTHSINILEDSILYDVLGKELYVNSYHHQSIKDLGKDLKVVASSKDGVIEAVEKIDSDFVVAVQWHPERMINTCDKMLNLFRFFIDKCGK